VLDSVVVKKVTRISGILRLGFWGDLRIGKIGLDFYWIGFYWIKRIGSVIGISNKNPIQ
jgi:hypothetical protein